MYMKIENSFSSGDFCPTPGGLGILSDHPSSTAPPPKRDPGGIGFIDEIGGCTDGFGSCTESLGFESSDERFTDQELGEGDIRDYSTIWGRVRRRSEERRAVVERAFPPPMTSLDKNGRRNFTLRPVRKDGRLELTVVSTHRPEIMYATRENGRLTLRLIETPDEDEQEQEEGIEEEEDEVEERAEEAGDCELKGEEEREGGGGGGCECRSPASGGEGGEALRRCYEYEVAGHQHLNVWSPRVVTTM